jgi:hypothetical protein
MKQICYTYFSNVFDSMDHVLLKKVSSFSFSSLLHILCDMTKLSCILSIFCKLSYNCNTLLSNQ